MREVVVFGPTDFDDAYMFLRYAHNLRHGQGLAGNPSDGPVFGVTSPADLLVYATHPLDDYKARRQPLEP